MVHRDIDEYIKAVGKDVIIGLTDGQVWVQLLTSSFNLPNEVFLALDDENITIYQFADKGLEEFKKRFRGE